MRCGIATAAGVRLMPSSYTLPREPVWVDDAPVLIFDQSDAADGEYAGAPPAQTLGGCGSHPKEAQYPQPLIATKSASMLLQRSRQSALQSHQGAPRVC